MWFAAVYFSYLFYGNNIANYWMVYFQNVFQSNVFAIWNGNITKNGLRLIKELM